MSSNQAQAVPDEPPPSYSQATGSSTAPIRPSAGSHNQSHNGHLAVPGSSGISAEARRSMEDQGRPLPTGWVRCYDNSAQHQYFVNTTKSPPTSIWTHPYDDEDYLATLPSAERERIEHENQQREASQSKNNAIHYDSDSDNEQARPSSSNVTNPQLPPRPTDKEKPSLGRKLKDKLTGMTHEERELQRKQRAEAEQQAYEQHLQFRRAMSRAVETGQPQLLGRDRNGKEVYVEPPSYRPYPGSSYGPNAYGYNPYSQGLYASPNAAYMRPGYPYRRPYGRGYGGGYGLPLAVGGGLLGGLLLTDMMF